MSSITDEVKQKLVSAAEEVSKNAHAPFSKFQAGAAILAENDQIYTGVNVECLSFGLTVCAEKTAVVKMVSDGVKGIKAVAPSVPPCGACRQFMQDFTIESQNHDFPIFLLNTATRVVVDTTMDAILPKVVELDPEMVAHLTKQLGN